MGIDLSFKAAEKWKVFGDFEYHWARYRADSNWGLRTDFSHPKSFRQRAIGDGVSVSVGVAYLLSKRWSLHVSGDVQDWGTAPGILTYFFSDGTNSDTRLNRVGWNSWAVLLGSTYSF